MDEVSLNTEPVGDDDAEEFEIEGDCAMTEYVAQTGVIQGENPLPPAVGMEFESYEDVYYFYNCYAKDQGFGVRVSNTWYRKSKEKYRGKLSCSSAGFKKKSEANRPRLETRTGCPAMIKFRLMENKRWRIIEVELEHNHLTSPDSGKFYKSHKLIGIGAGTKRTLQLDVPEETQKIRMFRTVIVNAEDATGIEEDEEKSLDETLLSNQLKLKPGDAQAVQNFFCHLQLTDPNFFYAVDLNEKGNMRNLFWIDTRSRVAYSYFNDVVAIDNTCLADNFEVPLVSIVGTNHHGQPILLGCGLLANDTIESYTWLLRAWLTCIFGRPPRVIVSNQCEALQATISDVFPRASHCLNLAHIMQRIPEYLGRLLEFEAMKLAFTRTVYYFHRPEEFEAAWEEMIQSHGIKDNKWIKTLYDDRRKWVPAHLKDTFLAGMLPVRQNETLPFIFEGFIDRHTPMKEFLGKYDQVLQRKYQLEALADMDSKNSNSGAKSSSYFDLQLSKRYTNEILRRFELEVEGMFKCFNIRQVNADGPTITYTVKEQFAAEENRTEIQEFEITYNAAEIDVRCACGLFNLAGYLCRHALSILNQNGIEEVPPQYVLTRWRKDVKRSYVLKHGCHGIDSNNLIHRYDHLYKFIVQVVEEGKKSKDHYKVTLQGLEDILSKLNLLENQQCD